MIVHESIANAIRHGQTEHIWVDVIQEPGKLIISVSNDGEPLPEPDAIRPGLGTQQIEVRTRRCVSEDYHPSGARLRFAIKNYNLFIRNRL